MLSGLNHITLAVSHLDTSQAFYTQQLGFKGHVKWDGGAYLSLGDIWLCLSLDSPCEKTDYTHIAFSVEASAYAAFVEKIRAEGVIEWKQNHSEGRSLYVLDPDGHKLEIHVGTLADRLESLKRKPYAGLVWL
ncbi:fosfomycin resistance glutathione transferase [Enterovibrio baiacu]|uniref:fosfomycin resistance glutathione transferase n=1 Tax=Enterovibrio baiacu TaxID=2491023 RepID=UPI0010112F6F|nr:fosfomycin resistance glutathione transferase [Enterovibrio baiacu]MBE1275686.1 fosfomycin resistance glutathione transferase [Enterovibrio baiacu]